MTREELQKQYDSLFPTESEKAAAFDRIAERYYFCNFGTMQKSDFDVLMFSVYLDRLLDKTEDDSKSYSDYTLSKYLGITQSRISSLKVKKELLYPRKDYDWRKAFRQVIRNAQYEGGKIRLFIPEKTLFIEVKNAIEEANGIVDVQLNPKLLQVKPEDFIDLMLAVSDETDRKAIRAKLKKELADKNQDTEFLDKPDLTGKVGDKIKDLGIGIIAEVIDECVPIAGKYIAAAIRGAKKAIEGDST